MTARSGWRDELKSVGRVVGVPATVAIVVTMAVTVGVGFLIVHPFDSSIGDLDRRIAEGLERGRTPLLNGVTGAATVLANSAPVAALWVAAMAVTARLTRSWVLPVFFLVAIGGEKLTYLISSIIVGRPRPDVEPLGHVFATNGFPSGHVGSAIVLYGGMAVAAVWYAAKDSWLRAAAVRVSLVVAVAIITGLVGFSRMYRGHHFLSDVLWGAVLGTSWLVLAWRLVLRDRHAGGSPSRSGAGTSWGNGTSEDSERGP